MDRVRPGWLIYKSRALRGFFVFIFFILYVGWAMPTVLHVKKVGRAHPTSTIKYRHRERKRGDLHVVNFTTIDCFASLAMTEENTLL